MTTILVCLAGLALIFLANHLFRNWIAFRNDDNVIIDGQAYSFDAVFERLADSFGLEGKPRSLIRYSFLKSRRAIAAYQASKGIPLDAAVALFIAGSASEYAKSLDKSARPLEVDAFNHIAAQAQAYGERLPSVQEASR